MGRTNRSTTPRRPLLQAGFFVAQGWKPNFGCRPGLRRLRLGISHQEMDIAAPKSGLAPIAGCPAGALFHGGGDGNEMLQGATLPVGEEAFPPAFLGWHRSCYSTLESCREALVSR
ncbi:Hypothetical protein DEACI_3191 [Acididesulfobacillus acetoxydans]|uniref:Uncharacterized protein n=1 Tax=Acididesulfobacillus acetoxydans TaxID=1561005 RepID=A0ABM9RGN7_9FIRM|nr:Hypothetical protein DEACI_3191 [Acididesulfobacillus acetoxydans]